MKVLKDSCLNGSSEMVTNLSNAVVTYLFNIIMLDLMGEKGVAAITIVLYGQFLFNALYMGFSMGVLRCSALTMEGKILLLQLQMFPYDEV